jgi:hypothetical protein
MEILENVSVAIRGASEFLLLAGYGKLLVGRTLLPKSRTRPDRPTIVENVGNCTEAVWEA